ncbi:zinc finger protein 775-like [Uloborus diversus]|uniref:zinc finger protein 775-like n=1 Tax=Uloborus diversus TaxID=327109 RepID=UPI00240A22AD|nr:zinc finger protein 775-like [Uloborus diversus]
MCKTTGIKGAIGSEDLFSSAIGCMTPNSAFSFFLAVNITQKDGKAIKCYKCPFCNHFSHFSANIKRHILTHTQERPHVCGICKMSFNQKITLQNHHMRVHMKVLNIFFFPFLLLVVSLMRRDGTSIRCYKCPFCSHMSNFSGNVKRHILTHTQERPYACVVCKKSFNQKINLQSHHIRIHGTNVNL